MYMSVAWLSGSKKSTKVNKKVMLRRPAEGMTCYTVCYNLEDYSRKTIKLIIYLDKLV